MAKVKKPTRKVNPGKAARPLNGETLRAAVTWALGRDLFAGLKRHGNTTWTAVERVVLTALWVWSDQKTLFRFEFGNAAVAGLTRPASTSRNPFSTSSRQRRSSSRSTSRSYSVAVSTTNPPSTLSGVPVSFTWASNSVNQCAVPRQSQSSARSRGGHGSFLQMTAL
jgi:hypothetical protein